MASTPTERPTRSTSSFINSMNAAERREYMRRLALQSHAGRLQLNSDEREHLIAGHEHLTAAYEHIGAVMRRHRLVPEVGGDDDAA